MKKITLLCMLFVFTICFNSYAQISEDFETDPPSGWTFMQTEGDDPGFVQSSTRAHGGIYSFYHNDEYIAVESTSWMISPSHTVSMGEQLLFWYNQNWSESYNVYSGVWISTTSADPISNPSDFTELFEFGSTSEDAWTEFVQNLDTYNTQTIYVAFKYTGDGADEIYIDDFSIDTAPTNTADWNNLQWPPNGAITTGDAFEVYAQIWEDGVTDGAGQGTGIEAWLGYSSADTDPSTGGWTWIISPYFGEVGNNDEFLTDIGSGLAEGTHYYASRFRVDGGPYTYGGINSDGSGGGGFWDGSTYISGVLTVTDPPPPANDDCGSATPVTSLPFNLTEDASGATNNGGFTSCDGSAVMNDGVWYTFVPGNDGTLDIEITNVVGWDPEVRVFSGSCGTFTCVANADSGFTGDDETLSSVAVTTGTQYWINVGYWNGFGDSPEGPFDIDITTSDGVSLQSLSVEDNIIEGFSIYPNPVNDVLNFRALDNIEDIRIYNLLGQEVLRAQPRVLNTQVDMADLPTGMYVVKIQVGEQLGAYRIVKE